MNGTANMKIKKVGCYCVTAVVTLWVAGNLNAQLPPDFPAITTHTYDTNALGAGYVFIASMPLSKGNKGLPHYVLILKNDGSPYAYKKVWYQTPGDFYENDFKVLPNGLLHYSQFFGFYSYTGGGTVEHVILDETLTEIPPRIQMGNGYVSDSHDFELMPNGHTVLVGYYTTLTDLSQVVPGVIPARKSPAASCRNWTPIGTSSGSGAPGIISPSKNTRIGMPVRRRRRAPAGTSTWRGRIPRMATCS